MYSGYIVSAPPSLASYGVLKRSASVGLSPGSGLVPGRKCRTSPRGTAVSVASSQGYGYITIAGSYCHIIELRMYGSVIYTGSYRIDVACRKLPTRRHRVRTVA